MKILVTGHEGFVGGYFYRLYKDEGHDVLGIDIKSGIDARDFFRRSDTRFDLIVHCAAVVGGRMTISGSPLAVAVDLAIDAEMFQWALRTKCGRIVYFSSCAAYPVHLQTAPHARPTREGDIFLDGAIGAPDLTYGWAKLTGEMQAMYVAEEIPTHVFRPFSGYGPGQDMTYPFPSLAARARARQDPFEIWGNGTQIRDFVHITDIVDTVRKAVDEDYRETLNIGWGRPTTFNELACMMQKEKGYTPGFHYLMDKPVGPTWRVANTERLFSFRQPRVTLEEGVAECMA